MDPEYHEHRKFDLKGFMFSVRFCLILCIGIISINFVSVNFGSAYGLENFLWNNSVSAQNTEKPIAFHALNTTQLINLLAPQSLASPTRIAEQLINDEIPKEGRFVAADLNSMQLSLYENGTLVKTMPILSKGRKGSLWETPTGLYSILTKEKSHFSSIGSVYMPYSMQFYGNFFIHGWPYYPDGKSVPTGYSGGCIRLATEDAKQVFEFVQKNTPIFVYENSTSNDSATYPNLDQSQIPNVSAQSYLVADLDTGTVFAAKDENSSYPIASITKLMTAIVANETIDYRKKITITNQALHVAIDNGSLLSNEVFTLKDLFYPMLMESSNSAARAAALFYGQSHFVQMMNTKGTAIGMTDSHFADAAGISSENTSTVSDIYKLSRYIYTRNPFIFKVTRTPTKNITSSLGLRTINNFNLFSDDPHFIGGKIGHTNAAKDTMVALFTIPTQTKPYHIVIIVLSSDNQKQDIMDLRSWIEKSLSY